MENVQWGADYLLKTFRPGNANSSVTDAGYTIVYQVRGFTAAGCSPAMSLTHA